MMTSSASLAARRTQTGSGLGGGECEPGEQYIFLLELYVHRVESPRLSKLNAMFCCPTSLGFGFLGLRDSAMTIEPRLPPSRQRSDGAEGVEAFGAGRSVLFALSRELVRDKGLELAVRMRLGKRLPPGQEIEPPELEVGEALLDFSPEFAALRKELLEAGADDGCESCPSKCFEGAVPLTRCSRTAGLVRAYLRITALGRSVVTAFAPQQPGRGTTGFRFASSAPAIAAPIEYGLRVTEATGLGEAESTAESAAEPEAVPCPPCRIGSGARRQPLVLKVSGLLAGPSEPSVTLAEEGAPAACTDYDTFVLRIGKRGLVGADEHSDIQLEMRTPRGHERRPPLRMETREVQADLDSSSGSGSRSTGKRPKGDADPPSKPAAKGQKKTLQC